MTALLKAGDTLLLASHNRGKIFEFRAMLAPYGIELIAAIDAGVPEPEETGDTFAANAELKARACAGAAPAGAFTLADDSGLAVDALGGAPGIYSARWAEGAGGRDFGRAMARVEAELAALGHGTGARAGFICVLALVAPGGALSLFEGRADGTLRFPPAGANGFGYDPIFVADGQSLTFGELDPSAKRKLTHRYAAFQQFRRHALDG